MANATHTGEDTPSGGGPGTRWYKPSTGEWYTYNTSTEQWDLTQDGFASIDVVDLTVSGSITSGEGTGVTGRFSGITRLDIVNGIVVEVETD